MRALLNTCSEFDTKKADIIDSKFQPPQSFKLPTSHRQCYLTYAEWVSYLNLCAGV